MTPHTPESLAVLLGPDLKVTLQLRWASLPKNDCHARDLVSALTAASGCDERLISRGKTNAREILEE